MNKHLVIGISSLCCSVYAIADYQLGLQAPANNIAHQVYDLHNLLLLLCSIIFIAVFGTMFYSIFAHRKSRGHQAAHFHENTTIEVVWTLIPLLILIAMAYPATKTVLAMRNTRGAEMTVKVTGYQWRWGYDYLDEGISIISRLITPKSDYEQWQQRKPLSDEHYLLEVDNPLVVPVGKKIRILTTANDVIHSWWVPALAVKQDAIPGFIRETWFQADTIGTYRGQCTELCGKDHAFMPIVVKVVSEADYTQWLEQQKKRMQAEADDPNKVWTLDALIKRGERVYQSNCAVCHQTDGRGQGSFLPLDGSKIVTQDRQAHIDIVLHGKKAMPAWAKVLSDTEIAAVITYERNAWSNKTNEMVTPAEIKAVRH